MDCITFVTMESRPRLCAVNTYICYKKPQETSSIVVKLIQNSIILEIDDKIINLPLDLVDVTAENILSLNITDDWISFRIQTKPSDCKFGSFQAEILNCVQNDEKCVTLSTVPLPNKKCPTKFYCASCHALISKTVEFHRVLPLPKDGYDPAEWFCCSHSDNNLKQLCLSPKDTDYFYRPYYFVVNKSVFIPDLKIDDFIRCQRCFSVLGLNNDHGSVKVWNFSVEKESEHLIIKGSEPVDDFLMAVKESTSSLIGQHILIESPELRTFKYILLKPMEMNMELLTDTDLKHEECDSISLTKSKVMKIMYIYGESDKSMKEDYPKAKQCRVESCVFTAGLEHLISASNRFPPHCRMVDNWYIGYIVLPDMNKFFT